MDRLFKLKPFSLKKDQKNLIFDLIIDDLKRHHYNNSKEYKRIVDATGNYFLPVRIFKELDLKSTHDISKKIVSSGTSSMVSKIYLDRETAFLQTRVLLTIMQEFLGKKKLPMLIVDTPSVLKDKKSFSARGVGMLGFSMFGKNITYLLDDDMQINMEVLTSFLSKYKGQKILMFGFTFMVWEFLYKKLKDNEADLSQVILIHGGGWKKLQHQSVSNNDFKNFLYKRFKLKDIHNYYGMVEQTGSIFVECEEGYLHTSNFSDIHIVDEHFNKLGFNQEGAIELITTIAKSYPGFDLISEDRGIIFGEDDCKCGRCGKYFKVLGRLKEAEIRGCSDTFR